MSRATLRVLLNTYPWVALKRNRELRVHDDLRAMALQFDDMSFDQVTSPLAAAFGNAALTMRYLAGRVGLDKRPGGRTILEAIGSVNWVPARHVRGKRCDLMFAHEYFPANLDSAVIPIVYETQLVPEGQLAAYGFGSGSRERELRLKRFCAARAAAICVRDPAAAELAREALVGGREIPVEVVPWYLPYLEPARDAVAKHADAGACRVLFVGNDARRKGLPTLVAALALLPPATRGRIELTVVSRFLDGAVPVPGARVLSDLPQRAVLDLMRDSHVFVLPTRSDTFGMVLLEALASGCAVISSTQEPQSWILDHGEAGRLVPAEQPAALAAALMTLADSPAARSRLAAAGHERFLRVFHHRMVASRYRSVFERARRPPRGAI